MYVNGNSIRAIARYKNMSMLDIEQIIIDEGYIRRIKPRSSGILGSKTETYCQSEEQMLNPPVYEYKELSNQEKEFYESRTDM